MLIKKILSYAFYTIYFLLLLLIIAADISPRIAINTRVRLLCAVFVIILVIAATVIRNSYLRDKESKIKTAVFSYWILFIFYSVNLFMMLFLDMTYGRTAIYRYGLDVDHATYFRANTNFIPFKEIIYGYENIAWGNIGYFVTNILGNLFAFAPMGFFIPLLFKRINSLKSFVILILSIIMTVEIMQFITMTGRFDIDDVILNSFGAIITYIIVTKIKKYRNKIN